jgi:hypothetical protein
LEAPASKEELGEVLLGTIKWVSTKTLPTHSTFAPTNVALSLILEGEDYGLKASINVHNERYEGGLSILK